MKIAYRRMSGAVGLTEHEQGTRGLWWEKRKALVGYLEGRGHQVTYCNRMTKPSAEFETWSPEEPLEDFDVLLIEFGSSNSQFYGDDLDTTFRMANAFQGPKVFLCDDPDLPLLWDRVSQKDWVCWHNAKKPTKLGKQPARVPVYDMPFASLVGEARQPVSSYDDSGLVYIGRPLGRGQVVRELIAHRAPWKVYGKVSEWVEFGVFAKEPPTQPERADFYSKSLGCLALADKKHKQMGWRTGRAYHAALAGCPALVEADHAHLKEFPKFHSVEEIRHVHSRWQDPELRYGDWCRQADAILADKVIADKTAATVGL